jgi:hypothetical protein
MGSDRQGSKAELETTRCQTKSRRPGTSPYIETVFAVTIVQSRVKIVRKGGCSYVLPRSLSIKICRTIWGGTARIFVLATAIFQRKDLEERSLPLKIHSG